MPEHPDLRSEQAYIDHAYERVEAIRDSNAQWRDSALRWQGGTHQAVDEREVFVRKTMERLSQLDIGDASLVFGRIDRDDGDRFYIGRLAIPDEEQEQLVVDWRAPVAEPFYRATGRHPLGLSRRRHFFCDGRLLKGIEDEGFADGEGDGELGLAGPGALLAALERARTGQMRDIVATIQKEQDEIIRSDLGGVLAVQGGPGTGKTAVALHRAAYLLFTHRRKLGRLGMLVVGPNRLFLRYIDQVLPALGESGVVLATINGLVEGMRVKGTESTRVARIKGDALMVDVVARAVADRQRWLRHDVTVSFGPDKLVITTDDSRAVWRAARRGRGSHNRRRRQVEALLAQKLYARYLDALRQGHQARQVEGEREFARLVRSEPEFVKALDRMWPSLTAPELIHDLFGSPVLIASAAGKRLSRVEQQALHRPRSSSLDDVEWTSADLALIDEAFAHLGRERRRRRTREDEEESDEVEPYGHVVVDEVQDFSPMQLRMIRRRSLTGSMTVVGDLAQATGPWAADGWDDIVAHLPSRDGWRQAELTVSYRTPTEVMEVAGRVLRVAAPALPVPRTVRSTGWPPEIIETDDVAVDVTRVVKSEHDRRDGSVAVIHPRRLGPEIGARLRRAGVPFGDARRDGLHAAVTLVPVNLVKGLEFDSVVVVEPARMVRESPQGVRALFVALTRATKRLTVVHAEPLPVDLHGGPIERVVQFQE